MGAAAGARVVEGEHDGRMEGTISANEENCIVEDVARGMFGMIWIRVAYRGDQIWEPG